MAWMKTALSELVSLFVEDGSLALAILIWLALAGLVVSRFERLVALARSGSLRGTRLDPHREYVAPGARRPNEARRMSGLAPGLKRHRTCASNMDRMAEGAKRGFEEGFAPRRVREDGAGDVLEPRAHLDRKAEAADSSEIPSPTP